MLDKPDELGLDCITEEECHHAGVDLVLQHPGSPAGSVHSEEGEGVEGGENHEDEEKFTNTNYLGGLQPEEIILKNKYFVMTLSNL